jgi:hypothetical protein
MEHWWNDTDRGKLKYWEKTFPIATLSTINLICTFLGVKSDLALTDQQLGTRGKAWLLEAWNMFK